MYRVSSRAGGLACFVIGHIELQCNSRPIRKVALSLKLQITERSGGGGRESRHHRARGRLLDRVSGTSPVWHRCQRCTTIFLKVSSALRVAFEQDLADGRGNRPSISKRHGPRPAASPAATGSDHRRKSARLTVLAVELCALRTADDQNSLPQTNAPLRTEQ